MQTMTYAEWYQTVEKPRLAAIPADVREANDKSHAYGVIDDCERCLNCEVGIWNGWKEACFA